MISSTVAADVTNGDGDGNYVTASWQRLRRSDGSANAMAPATSPALTAPGTASYLETPAIYHSAPCCNAENPDCANDQSRIKSKEDCEDQTGKGRVIVNSLLCFVDNFRHLPNIAELIRRHFNAESQDAAIGILSNLLDSCQIHEKSVKGDAEFTRAEKILQLFDTFFASRDKENAAPKFVAADLTSLPLTVSPFTGPQHNNKSCDDGSNATTKSITDIYKEIYSLRTYLQRHLRQAINCNRDLSGSRYSIRTTRPKNWPSRTLRLKSCSSSAEVPQTDANLRIYTTTVPKTNGLSNSSALDCNNATVTTTTAAYRPNSGTKNNKNNENSEEGQKSCDRMFPNYFQSTNPGQSPVSASAPLKTYYQASAPTSLLTPAAKRVDSVAATAAAAAASSPMNTLMLLAAASSAATPCKASPAPPLAKKRRLDANFHAATKNHAAGSPISGNRLDRAVRKLTNRLEAKIMEPNHHQTKDSLSAISPTSSASSTASSGNCQKLPTYDGGSYSSNCEGVSSNESSTQTTPIKRTASPETPTATVWNPLLAYVNTPNNFYKAKLASLLHSSNGSGVQLQNFLQSLSAAMLPTAPQPFPSPSPLPQQLPTVTAAVSAQQPASAGLRTGSSPMAPINPGAEAPNYIQFFKNLATAAALLSNSSPNSQAASMPAANDAASMPNDQQHIQSSKTCWSENEEVQGLNEIGVSSNPPAGPSPLAQPVTTLAGPNPAADKILTPFTDDYNKDDTTVTDNNPTNNNNKDNIVVKREEVEEDQEPYNEDECRESVKKLEQHNHDDNNNNNGGNNNNSNNNNVSDEDGGFGGANFDDDVPFDAKNARRSPSSNDSVDNDAEKPFACTHANCHKRFTNKFLLKKHQFIHTGLRPHACPFCSKRFNRKDNLLRHKKTHLANGSEDSCMMTVTGGRRRHNNNNSNNNNNHGGGMNLLYDVPAEAMQLIKNAFPGSALYSANSAFGGLSASMLMGAAAAAAASANAGARNYKRRAKRNANGVTVSSAPDLTTASYTHHNRNDTNDNNGSRNRVNNNKMDLDHAPRDDENTIIDPVTMDEAQSHV